MNDTDQKAYQEQKQEYENAYAEFLDQAINNWQGKIPPPEDIKDYIDKVHISIPKNVKRHEGLTIENRHKFPALSGYPMKFLNGLEIPQGLTVIGAPTGGGKTTALFGITRELLRQGKKVSIITLELSKRDFALQLTLSIMAEEKAVQNGVAIAQAGIKGAIGDKIFKEKIETQSDNGLSDSSYFVRLKSELATGTVPSFLNPADNVICAALKGGNLQVLDLDDITANVYGIGEYIKSTKFDAYCLDYVQLLRTETAAQDYRRVAEIMEVLRPIANSHGKTIITGAQFNREGMKSMGTQTDRSAEFDPIAENFRESADIEQAATLAIGTGYFTDKEKVKKYFWKILKHRYAGSIRGYKMANEVIDPYYFTRPAGKWMNPAEWDKMIKNLKPVKPPKDEEFGG